MEMLNEKMSFLLAWGKVESIAFRIPNKYTFILDPTTRD